MQTNFELKKHNTIKIFQALRTQKSVSRKELAKITGLSWGSVSSICNELIVKNIVLAEKEASGGGRPAERLILNPTHFLQLGIDINSIGLHFVVVNLCGDVVYSQFTAIESRDKNDLLQLLFDCTKAILAKNPNVIGINLSMQGKINRKTGVSLRTNFFKDWKNIPLVSLFEEKFSLPTSLYHDPDCLLSYHLQSDIRLKNATDGFVIRIDDGIGMARLLREKPYQTGDDTSYELGHIISVPDGRTCPCGKKGCLETYASLRGMKEIYMQTYRANEEFTSLLKEKNAQALSVLQSATDHLGIAIANLFTLSAPTFILLDGALFAYAPYCFEHIKQNAEKRLGAPCNLLLATYTKEAPAIGACLLTIEKNTENFLFA